LAWRRRRWRGLTLVVLLAGIAAGAVLALAAGARRTASGPDRYTHHQGGDPDLILRQPFGPPLTEAIAQIPEVREARSMTFVSAFPVGADGPVLDPNPWAGDERALGSRPAEGRFTDAGAADEMTVNKPAADLLGVDVGDRLDIKSFSQAQVAGNEFRPGIPLRGPSFEATVVGIIESPSDLEDGTPSIYFSGHALRVHPDIGTVATFIAVRGEPGTTPQTLMTAIRSTLPEGTEVYEDESQLVTSATRRAIRLHVVALWVVVGVSALVAILLIVQLAARQVRNVDGDRETLRALGYEDRHFVTEATIRTAILGAAAAVVAVTAAITASAFFPIGSLRVVEPDAGIRPDLAVALIGGACVAITFVIAGVTTALRTSQRSRSPARLRPGVSDLLASTGAAPTLVNGVRFATTTTGARRSRPYAATLGVVAGIAGVVGALLVATSLVRLLHDPPLWGADYDALYGNPFARTDRDLVTPAAADPDVAGLTAATQESVALDGTDAPVLAYESIRGAILPVILDGRAPSAPNEIALGRILARDLDRSIDDTVTAIAADGSQHELRIVGYTVSPTDGGRGASMTFDALHSLVPDATRNLLLVDYRAGASRSAVQARLETVTYTPPDTDTVPPSVRAFELVIPAALALTIILALMVTAALTYHLASSVHRRTRDLAILRALGADRRQLRATVHWQACFVAAAGLVIGVPLGIAVGIRIHNSIANSLGVVPTVATPNLIALAMIAGVLVIANVSAIVPARRATRAPAAAILRESVTADT
jgi:ABC-type lipoprotein release transport system permease subunit